MWFLIYLFYCFVFWFYDINNICHIKSLFSNNDLKTKRNLLHNLCNVLCTTNVHTSYNNMKIIFNFYFLLSKKYYSFFIIKIIFTSSLLHKVYIFIVYKTLPNSRTTYNHILTLERKKSEEKRKKSKSCWAKRKLHKFSWVTLVTYLHSESRKFFSCSPIKNCLSVGSLGV